MGNSSGPHSHHHHHPSSVSNSGYSPLPLPYPPGAVAAAVAASAASSNGSNGGSSSSPLGGHTHHGQHGSGAISSMGYGSGGGYHDNIQSSATTSCHPNSQTAHWAGGRSSHLLSQNHFGSSESQVGCG